MIREGVLTLFSVIIKEFPVEIKTIIHSILISFSDTKSSNTVFREDNYSSISNPIRAEINFDDLETIETMVHIFIIFI